MPEFASPFVVMHAERKLTKDELVRAIRFNIASEYEAAQFYEQLAESTDNKNAKRLLKEIADDELVHVGNFQKLLFELNPDEQEHYAQGHKEAIEVMEGKNDDD